MKKKFNILTATLILTGLAGVLSFVLPAEAKKESSEGILVTTIEDIGRDYEILGDFPGVIYKEAPRSSLGGDPMTLAAARAVQAARDLAKQQGADAIIGLQVSSEPRTSADEGGVLLIGTLIKYK